MRAPCSGAAWRCPTMSTEIEDRLARLAPEVDLDAARAEHERRGTRSRHRRALAAGTGITVVIAATIALIAAPWHHDRASVRIVAIPTTTSAPAKVATQTTIARGSGVEVRLTAPVGAAAGTRVWFTVTVQNVGTHDVWWQAGGCRIPVAAS